jgi:CheY-like chemotaxis protein
LEEELPVNFPLLAKDNAFASLLENLTKRRDFGSLRHRLQRHPLKSVQVRTQIGLARGSMVAAEERDLYGLRILWIDDDLVSVSDEVEELTRLGANVQTVSDVLSARDALQLNLPDVLISDIKRGENESAGLDDLESFRKEGIYEGRAIFFTGRITPSRQRRADSLRAQITTESEVLLDFLAHAVAEKAAVAE